MFYNKSKEIKVMFDSIEFYTDKQIDEWIKAFQRPENQDKVILSSVPFSWHEVIHEWRRRQNCEL
jgi:hypothetical protein